MPQWCCPPNQSVIKLVCRFLVGERPPLVGTEGAPVYHSPYEGLQTVSMRRDRMMIWMFDAAPAELQRMHTAGERPLWIAFIPRELYGADLDEAIQTKGRTEGLSKYTTNAGDTVYMGSSEADRFLETAAARESQGGIFPKPRS